MSREVFLSDNQRGRSHLVLGLGSNVDTALFGLLRIQSALKKVENCELVHFSMFFCRSMSRWFAGDPK
jgi:hypothetical protein